MRRVDLLINASREETESQNFSPDTGIQDSQFLQFLNDAQDRVYSNILQVYPNEYLAEQTISVTAGNSLYPIPYDAYLGSKVKLIEYSFNALATSFYKLEKVTQRERFNAFNGMPNSYIRSGSSIRLNPGPVNNGALRFTYFQKVPYLDLRRGKVLAVTLDNANLQITSLQIDISSITTDDVIGIPDNGYLTVVNKDGIVQMNQIPVASIDPNTGIVTLDGPFTFLSGQTISVGNYICMGKNSTSHSQLDDSCERYLVAHCNWKIQRRDSSNDSIESNEELNSMMSDIINAYKDADEDIDFITTLDTDYLTFW